MNFTPTELGASIIFAVAVLHTFCTTYFEALAKKSPTHSGLWHLLGEVEIVFGFWAAVPEAGKTFKGWNSKGLCDDAKTTCRFQLTRDVGMKPYFW